MAGAEVPEDNAATRDAGLDQLRRHAQSAVDVRPAVRQGDERDEHGGARPALREGNAGDDRRDAPADTMVAPATARAPSPSSTPKTSRW